VLANAGYRCAAIENGVRCDETERLEAHHVRPIALGGDPHDPTNGAAVCPAHHRVLERQAVA
jgi:predicted restriction endonuclease